MSDSDLLLSELRILAADRMAKGEKFLSMREWLIRECLRKLGTKLRPLGLGLRQTNANLRAQGRNPRKRRKQ